MQEWKMFGKYGSMVIIAILVITFIGWALWPASKIIERTVFKQSWQYVEGKAAQGAIFEANLVEVDAQLREGIGDAAILRVQKAAIKAQLRAIRINQ